MGEMLLATERANVARDRKAESLAITPPTLSALGLAKNESAAAQKLAKLPHGCHRSPLGARRGDSCPGGVRIPSANQNRSWGKQGPTRLVF